MDSGGGGRSCWTGVTARPWVSRPWSLCWCSWPGAAPLWVTPAQLPPAPDWAPSVPGLQPPATGVSRSRAFCSHPAPSRPSHRESSTEGCGMWSRLGKGFPAPQGTGEGTSCPHVGRRRCAQDSQARTPHSLVLAPRASLLRGSGLDPLRLPGAALPQGGVGPRNSPRAPAAAAGLGGTEDHSPRRPTGTGLKGLQREGERC